MANTYVTFYIHHSLPCDPMHESWSRLCFLAAYIWVGIISCYLQVLTLVQSYLLSEVFRKFGGHLCKVTLRVLRGPPKIHQDVCADPDNFRAQNCWMYVSQSRQLCTPCRGLCQCPDNFGGDPGRKYGCSLLLMGIILRCIGGQVGGWVT
jgi:hypothetical protein